MENNRFLRQFNWRFLIVRILVNAMALVFTATILPKIYFVDRSITNLVLMAVMLGVLNALLKPLLQFLTLPFIFVTYGLVIVLVNALMLWLLAWLFPARFAAQGLLWLLLGGLVLGLSSSFLESLMGLTMPVVPDEPPDLRRHLQEQARRSPRLVTSNLEPLTQNQAMTMEPLSPEDSMAASSQAQPEEDQPAQADEEVETSDPAVAPPAETDIPENKMSQFESQEDEKDS